MVTFSPKIGEMLLREGAELSVTFDGAEIRSTVRQADGTVVSLAAFLRSRQENSLRRAFAEKKNSVAARITALGGVAPPELFNLSSEEELNQWIAIQDPQMAAALRMGSDNFRAFSRAQTNAQPQVAPAAGLARARSNLNVQLAAHGRGPVFVPLINTAVPEGQPAPDSSGDAATD